MQILEDTDIFLSCSEAWRRRRAGLLHRGEPDIHHQSAADTANNKGTGRRDMKHDDFEDEYDGFEDN